MGKIENGKLIYHLTSLSNLKSIIQNGLLSRDAINNTNTKFEDTANHEILECRERLNLSNYVPFHFHIHTKYDTAVKAQNKCDFIYLCLQRTYAENNNFFILPFHPTSTEQPTIYSYSEGMRQINWNVMEMSQHDGFNNGIDDNYRNQVRMAECLSPKSIFICDLHSIAVKNSNIKKQVDDLLNEYALKKKPFIDIRDWF